MKKGFTIAEVMIVLTVIGALTAILLPSAFNNTPNEDLLKFKKTHNIFMSAVREVITSDRYYLDGDFTTKADGTQILGSFALNGGETTTDENLIKYFCTTLADVLTTKSVNCSIQKTAEASKLSYIMVPADGELEGWGNTLADAKAILDSNCIDERVQVVEEEMVLANGAVFYQTNPAATFGFAYFATPKNWSLFWDTDSNNTYTVYKPFCIDIDGKDEGLPPFGYGIRVDGKILTGARADEWLAKSLQGED